MKLWKLFGVEIRGLERALFFCQLIFDAAAAAPRAFFCAHKKVLGDGGRHKNRVAPPSPRFTSLLERFPR